METHGVPITIEWEQFQVGTSVFIPGVDQDELKRRVSARMRQVGLKVVVHPYIQNDILGVRVWRIP